MISRSGSITRASSWLTAWTRYSLSREKRDGDAYAIEEGERGKRKREKETYCVCNIGVHVQISASLRERTDASGKLLRSAVQLVRDGNESASQSSNVNVSRLSFSPLLLSSPPRVSFPPSHYVFIFLPSSLLLQRPLLVSRFAFAILLC